MSYNDGWDQVQNPFGNGLTTYGFVGGPMAFDIAAIQYLYGANMSYHTGGDTYTLPDINAPGTYWTSIWDAGGIDQIVYAGRATSRSTCAPRPSTTRRPAAAFPLTPTGSMAASPSPKRRHRECERRSGNDNITGNEFANILTGGLGNDTEIGGGGDDTFVLNFDVATQMWVPGWG